MARVCSQIPLAGVGLSGAIPVWPDLRGRAPAAGALSFTKVPRLSEAKSGAAGFFITGRGWFSILPLLVALAGFICAFYTNVLFSSVKWRNSVAFRSRLLPPPIRRIRVITAAAGVCDVYWYWYWHSVMKKGQNTARIEMVLPAYGEVLIHSRRCHAGAGPFLQRQRIKSAGVLRRMNKASFA